MKIFSRDKYEFIGVRELTCSSEASGDYYFAFRCIKRNFSPEVVFVKEARLEYANWGHVFFNECYMDTTSLCVKGGSDCEKSLIYNERKWRNPRGSLKGKVTSN